MNKKFKKIKLTRNAWAIVDAENFDELNKHKWCLHKSGRHKVGYAVRITPRNPGPRRLIYMQWDILGIKGIDHINGNSLDNRKKNLRLASKAENARNTYPRKNTSGYKGVRKNCKNWQAVIVINGKTKCLGTYKKPKQAHKEYIKAAKKYHGEFARWI